MDGAPKIKNMSRDVTTPLSGTVCRLSAGTSYDQSVHQIWSLILCDRHTHIDRQTDGQIHDDGVYRT